MLFSSRTLLFVSALLTTASFASPTPSSDGPSLSIPADKLPSALDYASFNLTEAIVARGYDPRFSPAEYFTTTYPEALHKRYPSFNFVVISTAVAYHANFEGASGYFHQDVGVPWSPTKQGFTVIFGQKGTFERLGDGGAKNWGWAGAVTSVSKDGSKIEFARVRM